MFSFLTSDAQDEIGNRWEWLMGHITPDMERALKQEAYRIMGNVADVQDVMQEVLIKAAMNTYQLKDENKLFQWLFTITRRESYAHISKYSFRALWNQAKLMTGMIGHTMELEDNLITDDDRVLLQKALERLDEEARRIVVLKTTTDDNLKVIAQKLGLNYHTTRSKYQRALSTMRDLMQEGEPNERH